MVQGKYQQRGMEKILPTGKKEKKKAMGPLFKEFKEITISLIATIDIPGKKLGRIGPRLPHWFIQRRCPLFKRQKAGDVWKANVALEKGVLFSSSAILKFDLDRPII